MTRIVSAHLGGVLVTAAALAAGCGGGGGSSGGATNPVGDATPSSVTVQFAAQVADQPVDCGQTYSGVGEGVQNTYRVDDFRFYIADVHLHGAGRTVDVELEQDGVWQFENVALLDFENGCGDAGTPATNTTITGTPQGDISGLDEFCFTLGVPFDKNHIDEATAASPLNASGMLWAWTSGRKFLRVDGIGDPGGQNVPYNVHLGSTGCVDSAGDPAPDSQCGFPNRAEFCLADFDPSSDVVVADLAVALEHANIVVNTAGTQPGCMSANSDPECIAVIPHIGLDFTFDDGANPPEEHHGHASLFRKATP